MAKPKSSSTKAAPPKRGARPISPTTAVAAVVTTAAPAPKGPTELLTALPALDDVQRDAFHGQHTDADCLHQGTLTQSGDVRACALTWAADAAKTLSDPALAKRVAYGATRLAWLVELIAALDGARAESTGTAGGRQGTRTTRDLGRERARVARTDLGEKLGDVVAGHAERTAELAAARAEPRTDEGIAAALTTLTTLTEALCAAAEAGDRGLAALLDSAQLGRDDAAAARAARDAFLDAKEGVALGGRARGATDSPAVNLIEGRIVYEMRRLRTAFARAREKGSPVAVLQPTPALQRVFTRPGRAADATDDAPEPAPAPPDPASAV